jgi:hypothetical protein
MQTDRFIQEKVKEDIEQRLQEKSNFADNLIQDITKESRRIKINL